MLKEQTVSEADQNEQVSHRTINGTITEIKSFFTDGKTFGFFTKDEFLKYIDTLNEESLLHLGKMFEFSSKSYPINHLIKIQKDHASDTQIINCIFSLPNGDISLTVPAHVGLLLFLSYYQEDIEMGWRELDDLLQEAHDY